MAVIENIGGIDSVSSNRSDSNQNGSSLPLNRDKISRSDDDNYDDDDILSEEEEDNQREQDKGCLTVVDDRGEDFRKELRELEEMLSKLNPMAAEFVPPSLTNHHRHHLSVVVPPSTRVQYHQSFLIRTNYYNPLIFNSTNTTTVKGRKSWKRRMNSRTGMAQEEEVIKRTVYVSDIDHQVTEEQLAMLFLTCGQVVDCRICGDPNSVLRFAFVEFTDEEGARNALNMGGTMLGYYPVRILPSKTAIAPVNPTFLPQCEDEREMCARTIYCTNIDKKITQTDVKVFFESVCGEVQRLRLLGDYQHSTRIAFVEFVMAESAIAALNCSGGILGSLPIRVSPSKTPVRQRAPRIPSSSSSMY